MSSKPVYPSTVADRFQLRLPPGLRDRIEQEALKNGRSMNAEFIARIMLTLDQTAALGGDDVEKITVLASEVAAKVAVDTIMKKLTR